MKVSQVSYCSSVYNCKPKNVTRKQTSFKADVGLYWGVRRSLGENKDKFKSVISKLKEKLAKDPINTEDTLMIGSCDGIFKVDTKYGPKKANLELQIGNTNTPFYYNKESSEDELVEQLYNGYKHTRYVEHYTPKIPMAEHEGLGEDYYSRM